MKVQRWVSKARATPTYNKCSDRLRSRAALTFSLQRSMYGEAGDEEMSALPSLPRQKVRRKLIGDRTIKLTNQYTAGMVGNGPSRGNRQAGPNAKMSIALRQREPTQVSRREGFSVIHTNTQSFVYSMCCTKIIGIDALMHLMNLQYVCQTICLVGFVYIGTSLETNELNKRYFHCNQISSK